ncbi:hypothetical protein [Breoghania sp.]|uniref:hypothetical protein n=1 Tax=Breoghania sp. TaxID=2065378 RepID=UPI002AABAD14|nr:hypothetical protein [Breoghania sp.]
MERFSTHIGIVVISFAFALVVTLTASRLVGEFSGQAHAAGISTPVFAPATHGESAEVTTNTAKKGDRIALDTDARDLTGRPRENCVSRGNTTVCRADMRGHQTASLD